MIALSPLITAIPLLGFWMWMFSEMSRNAALSSDERTAWTFAFIFMNVFAALWYYAAWHRKGA